MRRPPLSVIVCAGTVVLLTGCGVAAGATSKGAEPGINDSAQPPASEFRSAVAALGQASTLTTGVSVATTATAVADVADAFGVRLSPAQAATLAGAQVSVTVGASGGKDIADIVDGHSAATEGYTLSSYGTSLLSLRTIGDTVYLKADPKDLLTAIGKPDTYQSLESQRDALPAFAQALLDGKWVSMPAGTLQSLHALVGGGTDGGLGGEGDPQISPVLINGLQALLAQDVTVTRVSSGTVDRLKLTANSRVVAASLLRKLTAGLPPAGAGLLDATASKVPSRTVTMTADVVGGALQSLRINLGKYDGADVPLDVTFTRDSVALTAPSGAVAVDSLQLTELFGELAMGSLGGSGLL